MTTTTTTDVPLTPGTWTLDRDHSSVGFAIRHLGISRVRGVFHEFTVEVTVGERLEDSMVRAAIEIASIDTGNPDRDAHVLSDDLVDVSARPRLEFLSTSIEPDGDDWRLAGELRLGTAHLPVELELELGGLGTFPLDGTTHAGFAARTRIDRHDLGLQFGLLDAALGSRIDIELDIQLVAPGA